MIRGPWSMKNVDHSSCNVSYLTFAPSRTLHELSFSLLTHCSLLMHSFHLPLYNQMAYLTDVLMIIKFCC